MDENCADRLVFLPTPSSGFKKNKSLLSRHRRMQRTSLSLIAGIYGRKNSALQQKRVKEQLRQTVAWQKNHAKKESRDSCAQKPGKSG
jgi:hypothetical protein